MYLSRVQVITQGLRPETLFPLMQGNAYRSHQLLWKLFTNNNERPFLFRQELEADASLETQRPSGLPLFYVLSRTEPEPDPALFNCEVKQFAPKLRTGQKLAFRLRANPVVARRDEGRKNSRHHDVLMDAKQSAKAEGIDDKKEIRQRMDNAAKAWLNNNERSERNGYRLAEAPQIGAYQQHVHRRKGREIRFGSVDYQGTIEVTDPEKFLRTLTEGIGRSRAFGCGMWMVRPI